MGDKLTREQHARLAAELAELEGPKRAEVVEAISAARAHGDLSENFEYHAAKNEQGLLERRIVILRDRFDHAEIVEERRRTDVVSEGSHVVVVDETASGSTSRSPPRRRRDRLARLAARLGVLGKRVGDEVDVQAPSGPGGRRSSRSAPPRPAPDPPGSPALEIR